MSLFGGSANKVLANAFKSTSIRSITYCCNNSSSSNNYYLKKIQQRHFIKYKPETGNADSSLTISNFKRLYSNSAHSPTNLEDDRDAKRTKGRSSDVTKRQFLSALADYTSIEEVINKLKMVESSGDFTTELLYIMIKKKNPLVADFYQYMNKTIKMF